MVVHQRVIQHADANRGLTSFLAAKYWEVFLKRRVVGGTAFTLVDGYETKDPADGIFGRKAGVTILGRSDRKVNNRNHFVTRNITGGSESMNYRLSFSIRLGVSCMVMLSFVSLASRTLSAEEGGSSNFGQRGRYGSLGSCKRRAD